MCLTHPCIIHSRRLAFVGSVPPEVGEQRAQQGSEKGCGRGEYEAPFAPAAGFTVERFAGAARRES